MSAFDSFELQDANARIAELGADNKHLYEWGRKLDTENKKLREQLATELVYGPDRSDEAKDRIRSLEVALRSIQKWDCLNPPRTDLLGDLAWLKGIVDDALSV